MLPPVQVPVRGKALEVGRDSFRTLLELGVILVRTRDLVTCPLLHSGLYFVRFPIGECNSRFGKILHSGPHVRSSPKRQCKSLSETPISSLLDGRLPIGQFKSPLGETLIGTSGKSIGRDANAMRNGWTLRTLNGMGAHGSDSPLPLERKTAMMNGTTNAMRKTAVAAAVGS